MDTKQRMSDAPKLLEKYPKEVIIKAFLCGVGSFRAVEIINHCETILADVQFRKLSAQLDKLDAQRNKLLKNEPEGNLAVYYEWVENINKISDKEDVILKKLNKLAGV